MNSLQFTTEVRDISASGLGVVDHPNTGLTYFCRGVLTGDVGTFQLKEADQKQYTQIYCLSLVKKSPFRTDSPCPHHGFTEGTCGGCSWMMIDYTHQIEFKQKSILFHLNRSQLLNENTHVLPMILAPQIFGYRNRAQFKTDGRIVGFMSNNSQVLAPIDDCLILTEKNREHLQYIKQQLPNNSWKPKENHSWCYIEVDEQLSSDQIQINKRRPFQQANTQQNHNMKKWVSEQLSQINIEYSLMELFCGDGNFTEVIAQRNFKKILAIESVESAIEILKAKHLPNVEAHAFNLFKPSSWNKIKKIMPQPDVLFLDPPRDGFENIHHFLKTFPKTIKTIIYISCDIESFCRDARLMTKLGYRLTQVQGIDQFPNTPHIELMSTFNL